MGLVDVHAYSLISCVELTVQGKIVRLVKIRNPYGLKEWVGDWSDKAPQWTLELREQAGAVDANDGIFFISYEDYLNFFFQTTICKFGEKGKRSLVVD
jgi:calpain-15